MDNTQAEMILRRALPEMSVKAWAKYKDLFLFRVEYPSPEERDFDPFFSVNPSTGEVRDFSVLTDGDISEIAVLEWTNV